MISLLAVCPSPNDATSFYRGMGPLGRLKRESEGLNVVVAQEVGWWTMNMVDAVFLQRPFRPEELNLAKLAKSMKKPLWVDYDDDLFNVPTDNPTHHVYGNPKVQKNVAELCAMADIVSVSTKFLKERLAPLNKDIRVVPNAIDEKMFDLTQSKREKLPVVLWRGSPTHQRDLAVHHPGIAQAFDKFPGWNFHFQGYNPWFITDAMDPKRHTIGGSMPITEYFSFIRELAPSVMIVPLADNVFNRSKSNIAWIEGTYAGAAVLAPDWEEWRQPGATTYQDEKGFQDELMRLLSSSPEDLDSYVQLSREHLPKLGQTNLHREQILRELTGKELG